MGELHNKYIRTNIKLTDNIPIYYISPKISDEKKFQLLDEIGEDFIQTYLRSKKINRIMKR